MSSGRVRKMVEKKREPNFILNEIEILLDFVEESVKIIENTKTDGITKGYVTSWKQSILLLL